MALGRWWLLAAWGLGLAAAAVVWAVTAASDREYTVLWLGDSLLGDEAEPALRANGFRWAFDQLPPSDDPDLTVINAEGPITNEDEPWFPDQRWSYESRKAAAAALAREGVDVASLANNHAFDRGPDGLRDTMDALRAASITPIGAGSVDEAPVPRIVTTPHGDLAIIAFAEPGETTPTATEQQAGVHTLSRPAIDAAIRSARAGGAKWVAAFVHWGENYSAVLPAQREWARYLDEAGYDLVVGTGPHVVQPIERLGDMPVAYSIGNYVFGTEGRFTEEYPGYGLALTAALTGDGFRELRMTCIETDNEVVSYQPRPCDQPTSSRILLSLHPGVRMDGSTGILAW